MQDSNLLYRSLSLLVGNAECSYVGPRLSEVSPCFLGHAPAVECIRFGRFSYTKPLHLSLPVTDTGDSAVYTEPSSQQAGLDTCSTTHCQWSALGCSSTEPNPLSSFHAFAVVPIVLQLHCGATH